MAVTFFSCKKEEQQSELTPSTVYSNYTNLSVGNYWIYERFTLDTSGVYTTQNIFDSSYIEKDTLINGNSYYKLNSPDFVYSGTYVSEYLRDSLTYLVDHTGKINFSLQNFTDTFFTNFYTINTSDTVCYIFSKMDDDNFSVSLPAGNFVTKNYKTTFLMYFPHDHNGAIRIRNKRYAENVGLVEQTLGFYVSSPNYTVNKLIRYGQ